MLRIRMIGGQEKVEGGGKFGTGRRMVEEQETRAIRGVYRRKIQTITLRIDLTDYLAPMANYHTTGGTRTRARSATTASRGGRG